MSSNSLGRKLILTSFGESHGKCIGTVLNGCPAGLELSEKDIQPMLDLRRPGQSAITTQRKEKDIVEIISGVFRGYTTGAPITMIIWNKDKKSKDYDNLQNNLRPGHADYPAMIKYKKFNDYRGGGRFSGRLTATHVMGGAVARKLLQEISIKVHSYTTQIGKTQIRSTPLIITPKMIFSNDTRCPNKADAKKMYQEIISARKSGDTLGGIIESVTTDLPVGMGEPIFGSLESDLSAAIYSIPSVKGVEFGSGFDGSEKRGTENNDLYIKKGKNIKTSTNNSGGILGGLSIGMPLKMRIAFKPVSSVAQKQKTVNIKTGKSATLHIKGRHDPCVVPRAVPVVDALVSLVLADHALIGGFIKQVL